MPLALVSGSKEAEPHLVKQLLHSLSGTLNRKGPSNFQVEVGFT
jgi:hypothetical protein